jgi:hypothetical protein
MRNTADVFFDVLTNAYYLRLNLERAIDAIFYPQNFSNFDFSYLRELNIAYGVGSVAASIGLPLLAMIVPDDISLAVIQTEAPKQTLRTRMIAYDLRRASPISSKHNAEVEEPKFKKDETFEVDEKLGQFEKKLTEQVRFDSWNFSSPEQEMLNSYSTTETTDLENKAKGLKGEVIGNTLWVWNEFGSLVAKIVLPVWMRSTIELMSYIS